MASLNHFGISVTLSVCLFLLGLCEVNTQAVGSGGHKTSKNTSPQKFEGLLQQLVLDTVSDNAGILEDLEHECVRPCNQNTKNKICKYTFQLEWYVTMSKACYGCPFNTTDCQRPHCAPADGHERPIVTANRRLPGPSIQVCEGDEIIVDVVNDLMSDGTAIHWHGIHQKGTPYMDGVPFLTQCPIPAGASFRYHFLADLPGTHYWHSHAGFQRTDGLFGALIVRSKKDSHGSLSDVDDPKHLMVITDWLERLGIDKFVNHHHTEHDNKPYNLLINGMGRFTPFNKDGDQVYTPVYEYNVKQGLRYRFRSVSNSIQNCPIEISVDQHSLLVIASDGQDIRPVEVQSLIIYGGERWDFVITANQTEGVYWVKFKGLLDCDDRFKSAYQVAVLRYEGAEGLPGRIENLNYRAIKPIGMQLNKLNAAPGDNKTFLTAADIRSPLGADSYIKSPKYKFWQDFDFYSKDNDLFHHQDFYPFFGVEQSKRLYVPQMNHISLKLPNVPPLSQPEDLNHSLICNSSSHKNCEQTFCHCTHTLSVELGSLVEIILVDSGVVYWANHPFHIHGHVFAVMGMGRLGENTTLEAVQDLDAKGLLQRNFVDPPLKDTVTVPDGGYTVIRFIASNPGYWLFHCHISFHVEVGMALVIKVGEQHEMAPVPDYFPRCGSWTPKPINNLENHINLWSKNKNEISYLNSKNKNNRNITYNCQREGAGVTTAPFILSGYYIIALTAYFMGLYP